MKNTLIGLAAGAALTFSAGTALADGYAYGSVKDAAPVQQVNWNGLYIGGAVGYGIASTDRDIGFGFSTKDGLSNDGLQGVISLGYDRQVHSNIVLGVFADYAFGDLERTESMFNGLFRIQSDISDNWAIGARVGYVRSCCTMWYINAGYAQADHEWSVNIGDGDLVFGGSKKLDGYFLGGGVEQQIRDNLSLKLEYRYTDFGSENLVGDFVKTETDIHSVRLGVNLKVDLFGGRHGAPAHDSLK